MIPQETNTEQKNEQSIIIHTGGGTALDGSVDTGGGDFVGRDKIIQIGSLQIPVGLAVILCVGLLLVVVSVALITVRDFISPTPAVVQVEVPTPQPEPTPTLPVRMEGDFRIAVAQLAEILPSGVITGGTDGAELGALVFEELDKNYQEYADAAGLQVSIWQDAHTSVDLGPILSDDAEVRRQMAADLAYTISANMVIYGVLDRRTDPAMVTLEFYVAPELQRVVDLEMAAVPPSGRYRMGDALPIEIPLDRGFNRAGARNVLNRQSVVLFWLTLGFTHNVLGDPSAALENFRNAQNAMQGEGEASAKALVSSLIGMQYVWLHQLNGTQDGLAAAEEAFAAALRADSQYARAALGQAGVHYWRAQEETLAAVGTDDAEEARQTLAAAAEEVNAALNAYSNAVAWSEEMDDRPVRLMALVGQAASQRQAGQLSYIQGQASQEFDSAIEHFSNAVALAEPLLDEIGDVDDYRLLAQAYTVLGAARVQLAVIAASQGKTDVQVEHLNQAHAAFTACIEQRNVLVLDQLLADRIVNRLCRPWLERLAGYYPE